MKPNFLILVAARSGTTTLYDQVRVHPDVFMSSPKEPKFFESEYDRGLDYYYRTYFAGHRGERAVGEARVANLLLPYVPPRIAECAPEARLIVILRDPVERAYSHWWHKVGRGDEPRDFERAIADNVERLERGEELDEQLWCGDHRPGVVGGEVGAYLDFGYYAEQIQRYLRHFPSERLLVLFHEDLTSDAPAMIERIWEFLGVAPFPVAETVAARNAARSLATVLTGRFARRVGLAPGSFKPVRRVVSRMLDPIGRRPRMERSLAAWLGEHYLPHNLALRALLMGRVPTWLQP
jgi:hypothetical protein